MIKITGYLPIVVTKAYSLGGWQYVGERISRSPCAALRGKTGNNCDLRGHAFQFKLAFHCPQVCLMVFMATTLLISLWVKFLEITEVYAVQHTFELSSTQTTLYRHNFMLSMHGFWGTYF